MIEDGRRQNQQYAFEMRWILLSLVFFWVLASHADAAPRAWRDEDLGQAIIEGVADAENIWLRGSTGKVVRFVRSTGDRVVVAENVIDLLRDNDHLWALARRGETDSYYVTDLLDPESAAAIRSDRRQGDTYLHSGEDAEGQVLGLAIWPGLDRPVIVSQRGVVPLASGESRQRFAASLSGYGHLTAVDKQTLYVGYNRGEWGGGLRRVDLQNGAISFVTKNAERPCEGVLNPACAPIVGLFPDRQTPGCLIVGSGISHLGSSRGEVYRVCASTIEAVFSTPTPAVGDRWMMGPQPWPLDGLFEVSNGWVGTSRDRYFRSYGTRVEERPMPTFREWAGLQISDEQDGVLFLVSACCWGSTDAILYRAIAVPIS